MFKYDVIVANVVLHCKLVIKLIFGRWTAGLAWTDRILFGEIRIQVEFRSYFYLRFPFFPEGTF